jgi:hypothetical protein
MNWLEDIGAFLFIAAFTALCFLLVDELHAVLLALHWAVR